MDTLLAPPAAPAPPPAPASAPSPTPAPPTDPRPGASPWRRAGWWAVAAALVAGSVWMDAGTLLAIPFLFALVVPFEKLFPRHQQRVRRPKLGTDLAYAAAQPVLAGAGIFVAAVVGIASLAWLPGLAVRPFVTALPGWLQLLAGVALFDMVGYWAHRWAHEVPFLWRFHAVHHSTEYLDWVSGFRGHPFDGALLAPPFVFLLAAGFSPEVSGALVVVQIVTGLFLHANVRWRWRPIQRLVATPDFHHWHHADEADAHCTNYAALLPVWDQVFGTWFMPRDQRPSRYGVSDPVVPDGLAQQLAFPLRGLPGPRWVLRHPLRALGRALRTVPGGLRQIWASTTRPRHRPAR